MAENKAYENDEIHVTSFSDENKAPSSPTISSDVERSSTTSEIPAAYAGMPKSVLLHYSRQKKFVWARNILTGLVILTILTLLSMVIALIAVSPACQQFWQTSPIYQVYPKSFHDTNNDGIGDLKGIINKLPELKKLGVETLWLNPIYLSPQKDNGYDIQNYIEVDPMFGTMEDFENLVTEMHAEGMKIVMDFVPNHTSNESEWFIASSDRTHENHEKYKDYYVWVDGIKGTPPNNWQSVFSQYESSAWEWSEKRQQYYYHAFFKEQPDLNFRNPAVLEELENVLEFWLEKGVDGFRVDAIKYMYEEEHLRDNPLIDPNQTDPFENVYPDYTENQNGIHDIIADWRGLLKKYSSEPGVYRFMETEVYDDVDVVVRYYGTEYVKEADFPMNFRLIDLENSDDWTAANINSTVMEWMQKMPEGKWPNWVVGNHDNQRVVSRLGEKKARLAAILTMTLSGTPGIYYGEEIGMTDGNVPGSTDFRDPERTPMQWDTSDFAGFCSNCTPWLNVNENYEDGINYLEQSSDENLGQSMFGLYQRLIGMRSELGFSRGSLCVLGEDSGVFMYVRELPGYRWSSLVAINFDTQTASLNLKNNFPSNFPDEGTIKLRSSSSNELSESVNMNAVTLQGEEALIINFKPPSSSARFVKSEEMASRCFTAAKVCVNVLGLLEVC